MFVWVCVCVWCGCIVAGSYPVFFFNEMKRSPPAFSRKKGRAIMKRCPGAMVKLFPYDHEVMGSSRGNSFLQKCREILHT
jgi:hypothetical protein